MTGRLAGVLLVLVGAVLVLPQVFTAAPAQWMVAAGLALAVAGAVLIAEPHERG